MNIDMLSEIESRIIAATIIKEFKNQSPNVSVIEELLHILRLDLCPWPKIIAHCPDNLREIIFLKYELLLRSLGTITLEFHLLSIQSLDRHYTETGKQKKRRRLENCTALVCSLITERGL